MMLAAAILQKFLILQRQYLILFGNLKKILAIIKWIFFGENSVYPPYVFF